jgi:thiol-disulfide isomerase/thioredoxin
MTLMRSPLALLLLAALACVSCTQPSEPRPIDPPPTTARTAAPVSDVTLQIADRAKLDEILTSHRGNVVLVDFWSTSCIPCVEKLPGILAMQRKFQDRGLQVLTVSLDDPDAIADIRAFLAERGASGTHLISTHGSSPKSLEEFEIDLIPYYRLYNRAGELVENFEPGPDAPPLELSTIEAAVHGLL